MDDKNSNCTWNVTVSAQLKAYLYYLKIFLGDSWKRDGASGQAQFTVVRPVPRQGLSLFE